MSDLLNVIVIITNFILVPGLTYGSQLALGALGITITYSVLRFSNFAHGEMMSFGTMITILITWYFQSININIYPIPTAILAMPFGIISTIVLCILFDYLVFKNYRLKKSSPVTFMVVSVGVMFLLGGVIRFIIGPNDQNFNDGIRFIIKANYFKKLTNLEEGLSIKTSQGITFLTALIVVILLYILLNKTKTGKSMRAFSDNEDLALLSGIKPERVVITAWILTGCLATIAGTLYGLDKSYKPFIFLQLLLPIFSSAIVGGIGNPIGAITGGFIISFSEIIITFAYKKLLNYLLPDTLSVQNLFQLLSTDYKFSVSFFILLIVLILKPKGIFSGKTL